MMKGKYVMAAIAGFILLSCNKNQLSPSQYLKYVGDADNGLTETVMANELRLELTYLPCDYQVSNEFGSNSITTAEYNATRKQYENQIYFRLKIYGDNGNVNDLIKKYETFHSLLSYEGSKNIQLVSGGKKWPVSLYHFEPGLNLVPYITILFSFELKEEQIGNDLDVIISSPQKDKKNLSPFHFIIKDEGIKNLPELKIG